MKEQKGIITLNGAPLTLTGNELNIKDLAPDVELLDNNLKPVKLSSFKGKICIISTVPSLDTPICDRETRYFNQKATDLGNDIVVLTISMDLPFAQKRWCGAAGIDKVITLSDHKNAEFGTSFGVLIKELRLLSRTIFILDKEGVLRYKQIVNEIANEPDYNEILDQVKKII